MRKIGYRIFQKTMKLAMPFIGMREPKVIIESNGLLRIAEIAQQHQKKRLFIVTDKHLKELGLLDAMEKKLDEFDIHYTVFDEVSPNPTIDQIEIARLHFLEHKCDAIIAIGGGSVMDLAKAAGARIARPNKSIQKLKGILKVRKKIPLLICAPTTVGTGSEATLAAVVSDAKTQEKYAINDPKLIPRYAILDDELIKTLPKHLISTTGMDTLTHAIEAYLGYSNTRLTKRMALEAMDTVFKHLLKAYQQDQESLKKMHYAAYQAGVAFTRAYVGNVHAVAHTLGGFYHVPHGYANAIILPHILTFYGKKIYKKLAQIVDYCNLGEVSMSQQDKANFLIKFIEELNEKMEIPPSFKGIILEKDIPLMAKRASMEANPLYPVPVIMTVNDFKKIYQTIN